MKFDASHYVPVLKIKDNEKRALGDLSAAHANKLTPLLEIVERKSKLLEAHLDTAFKRLLESVDKFSHCFLDARELAPDGEAGTEAFFARADVEGIKYVPVVGMTRKTANTPAFHRPQNGFALRITRSELESGRVATSLTAFMKTHGLSPQGVDLIMDMGDVSLMVAPGVEALANCFLDAVPHHNAWRTFTLSGSAFPGSMGGTPANSFRIAGRYEWVAWRDGLYKARATLPRLPTFSDCAIQNPKGVENFDPKKMRGSAAARHASGDGWLLAKGVSIGKIGAKLQYPSIAKRIVTNAHGAHFNGAEHCVACEMVVAAAGGAKGFGSRGKWRRIGTTHHVVTVLDDLAALHWP